MFILSAIDFEQFFATIVEAFCCDFSSLLNLCIEEDLTFDSNDED